MSMIDLDAPDITDEEREIILAYRTSMEARVAINLVVNGFVPDNSDPEDVKRLARLAIEHRAKAESQQ